MFLLDQKIIYKITILNAENVVLNLKILNILFFYVILFMNYEFALIYFVESEVL